MALGACGDDLACKIQTALNVGVPAGAVVFAIVGGVGYALPGVRALMSDLITAEDERADELLDPKPKGDGHAGDAHEATNGAVNTDQAIRNIATTSESTPLLARDDGELPAPKNPRNARNYTLAAIGLAELVARTAMFVRDRPWTDSAGASALPAVQLAVWLYATLLPLLKPTLLPYYSLLAIFLPNLLGSFVGLYVSILPSDPEPLPNAFIPNPLRFDLLSISHTCLCLLGAILVLNTPVRITWSTPTKNAEGQNPALDDWATVFQWATFTWIDPLIAQGKKMALEEPDVWQLARNLRARVILKKFSDVKGSSFMLRLFKANARDLTITGTLILISSTLGVLQPWVLNKLLIAMESTYKTSDLTADSAARMMQNPSTFFHVLAADVGLGDRSFMNAAESEASRGRQAAYLWALVAFLMQLTKGELDLQNFYTGRRATLRAKTEAIGSIYEKALKRIDTSGAVSAGGDKKDPDSKTTDGSADMGKITSLVSTDTNRIGFFINVFQVMIQAPLSIVLAATFLYKLMGWSAFAGYTIFLIAIPANTLLMKWQFKIVMRTMEMRDRRMRSMNEVIQSIKFIKFSAWESRWIKRVTEQREAELKTILEMRLALFFLGFIWDVIPIVVASVSLSSFTYFAGHELTISLAFPALLTFQILTDELTQLPMIANLLTRVYGSVQRIGDFLDEQEVPADVCSLLPDYDDRNFDQRIGAEGATFVWNSSAVKPEKQLAEELKKKTEEERKKRTWRDTLTLKTMRRKPQEPSADSATVSSTTVTPGGSTKEQFSLRDISVIFPRGKITLVYGPTASGKSSLLSAILGEMKCLEGRVFLPKFPDHVDGQTGLKESISFCAQQPWLENQTIRENILFGTPFDRKRYYQVLSACALIPDLKILEDGDKTEIGEKGITLSGGQKARVALARAIYAHTKSVVLDDVLSAVDTHTASIIIQRCFLGPLMKDRTLVLVTHHVESVINHCAYVVRMSNGTIDLQGTESKVEDEEEQLNEDDLEEAAGKDAKDAKKLSDKETRTGIGAVKGKHYITLSYAQWHYPSVLTRVIVDLLQKLWVKTWSESYDDAPGQPKDGPTKTPFGFPSATASPLPYVFVYIGIQSVNALLSIVAQVPSIYSTIRAARHLFHSMLESVLRSPSRWFDKTPAGRILSRFSKDIDTVDSGLSWYVMFILEQGISMGIAVATISYGVPPFIIAAAVIFYLHYHVAKGYISTSRDLNRLESTLRSPVLSTFSELLRGVATVRAFGEERRFLKTMHERLDKFQAAFYYNWMTNFWLRIRFSALGALTFFLTTQSALMFGISAGMAAIVITQAQGLLGTIYYFMRSYVDAEQAFNGIERIQEYIELPSEPPRIIEGSRPPQGWPSARGGIKFDQTVIKYAPDLDPVLHGVSFDIKPKEKIGLVGRSGSGKSTLALSLFRFVDPAEGKIVIDGISIVDIGVEDLRERLTLIPQDAVLFKGTLRENLDPFNEYTDAECLEVLRSVQLLVDEPASDDAESAAPTLIEGSGSPAKPSSGASTPKPESSRIVITLESAVSEGGNNWSAGQRQLIAMARALLRKTSVITDHKIQHAIREGFRDGIMLIIAHRLHTIIECDRILVLEAGKVVEFDTPASLVDKEGGVFRGMCLKSDTFDSLREAAHNKTAPSSS
ncbi:P-loop containing nucleoside triphosphate hydrolase protein [Auriculariales sp. MPI-PUGE-AT-0066]|nr:P-loop containing nucleoside triphosphate hydrolase protein [Auriculariales sp. MPI-PUGE-AT-0066]